MHILLHATGIAARRVGPGDAGAAAIVRVDVVEPDGGGGDETHPAAAQQGFVAACTGAHKQCVGVAHQLGREIGAVGIGHLVGQPLDDALDVRNLSVNDNSHVLKLVLRAQS